MISLWRSVHTSPPAALLLESKRKAKNLEDLHAHSELGTLKILPTAKEFIYFIESECVATNVNQLVSLLWLKQSIKVTVVQQFIITAK